MRVGYVRVSTREQNTARQDELMKDLGVEKVFTDRISGKNRERPELRRMMDFVREGDSVTVESISRFARNTMDLLELTAALEEKKVQFISRKENIDTRTPAGKFMLAVFGALAEGIAIAKAEGRMTGRPRKEIEDFEEIYESVKEGKISASKAARELNISRSTWYRKVSELLDNQIIDL